MSGSLTTIGWLEKVAIPEWGIEKIVAKIDTGARTSAIHAESIQETTDGNVEFDVVLRKGKPGRAVHVVCPVTRRTQVRSSTGHLQVRYVVTTTLVLGGVEKKIEVTLSSRRSMARRMLIGRTALSGSFVVDCSETHLS